MSLDLTVERLPCPYCGHAPEGWTGNITHNLTEMANAAGLYQVMWRPEELESQVASDIIPTVEKGLKWLKENEDKARPYDAPNEWGTYEDFVPFVEEYLDALMKCPSGVVKACR